MEMSLLQVLLKSISSFINLPSYGNNSSELVEKYFNKVKGLLKLLKPVLEAIVDSDISSDERLKTKFVEMCQSVDESSALFQSWKPLSSNANFVIQMEALISKLRNSSLDCLELLKLFDENLPDELKSSSLEFFGEKIRSMGHDLTTSIIQDAVYDQVDGAAPSPDILAKISDLLCLNSNQEILIEAVALETLKENTEQSENSGDVAFLDGLISLITHIHDHFVLLKQSQTSSPVPIPADFCCPLSLELMIDPVIVSSGQTYERVYIRNWIDLGLKVCPKTRQALSHTNLIPNFTVKALIASWCETNNVKPPDPKISINHFASHLVMSDHSPNDIHQSKASSLHPRSTSEVSTSTITVEEPEDRKIGSRSIPYSGENDLHGSVGTLGHGLARSFSASAGPRNLTVSERSNPEASQSLEVPNHENPSNGDSSGDRKPEARNSTTLNSPQRGLLGSRNQLNWRRTERNFPRIVSFPPSEARAEDAEIETQVLKLIHDLQSSSIEDQRAAVSELRLLSKHNMDNRVIIARCGAIEFLVKLLRSEDARIQQDAVTGLLNLSINDNNKTAIANADAIPPLIHVLETGTPEAKENSAATLFSLSVMEDNKIKIGRSGAIGPLVDLLGNGTLRGKKDAATALFNLSIFHENKARIVQAGAVKHLVRLMDPAAGMVDKAVAVLANLATIPEGRTQIISDNGIPVLVEVVELGSARGKENAAAALLQLCTTSSRCCNLVLQEGAVPPLVALSQSGTPRAKEKAQALLSYFRSQRHGNAGRG